MVNLRRALLMMAGAGALASCAAQTVEVRPLKSGLSEGQLTATARVAEGSAQLALGNVGLAQEAFRKALRDDPGNVDAMMGLAACYDRMGRPDLSRQQYELALAAQPKDPQIYAQFAQSLVQQGEAKEAARVTAELATIGAAPEALDVVPGSVAVLPPPPMPDAYAAKADVRGASVAVLTQRIATAPKPGPQLVRLSLAEVALVTRSTTSWDAKLVSRSSGSTTYRFEARPTAPVVLLNAARSSGLAARTRAYLAERGMKGALIGNAPSVRSQSAILYHDAERIRAERIAAQFGFRLERLPVNQRGLTVLLGQDAARDRALRPAV